MGAQQSSAGGQGQEGPAGTPKTCYYELLGVERQATDLEIKKAYRRKALELHPDRNLNDVDTATKKFAEVQSAYEILSDPQERAWYDSHRDTILSGQDGADGDTEPATFRNVRLTTTEEIMSLIRRFNAAVPFNDEPTGFFGIARETFEHLALEEEAAADFERVECLTYATFGSADDEYETTVRTFYSSWAGFSTRKTFSWKDKYRLSDAPDRRVRRLMEKENKKFRDEAIRDFNDAVRFLVSFVRKRDPRYLPNSQTASDRQESLRSASAAQAARSRAANQAKLSTYEIPEWARARDEDLAQNLFSEEEDEDEEDEIEILECVVCNKSFKSSQQLEAHERSKKHIKAVQQLRRQMRKEGKDLDIDSGAAISVTFDNSASYHHGAFSRRRGRRRP
ncbi:DnaJ -like protein subfamily C member 21 [Escovopsis weberi]|uniref:DnaJ-like protein subfamily C member 21 n=1 Tax=Escovopsis weberi TaxID=150374 RepID=A0A0M8N034_ESCWE|nr:DnaJ -like protein subfamily C member 21 [Escovopsis weberi]